MFCAIKGSFMVSAGMLLSTVSALMDKLLLGLLLML